MLVISIMKITADTKELKKIISLALLFVSKFYTTPELSCFVINMNRNVLCIKASDGEKQIEIKMNAE